MEKLHKHRILIIEHSNDLGRRINDRLMSEGYEVVWETVSQSGLNILEGEKASPFSLIISSYRMPKMSGDEILEKARGIAPDTQRLLMIDSSEIGTIINAINRAQIHASLAIPFEDSDLILQVKQRCQQYDRIQNKYHLGNVAKRQNKQMYKMALNFKTKETAFTSQIEARKKEIRILRSKQSIIEKGDAGEALTLDRWVAHQGMTVAPESFSGEFLSLSNRVKTLLNKALAKHSITIDDQLLQKIIQGKLDRDNAVGEEEKIPGLGPDKSRLIDTILSTVYQVAWSSGDDDPAATKVPEKATEQLVLDDTLDLTISEDRVNALVRLKKVLKPGSLQLDNFLEFLTAHDIRFGITDDTLLETWLKTAEVSSKPFVVAKGILPEFPQDSSVTYFFETQFKQAGKVMPDGSIDFRDRGDIPFAKKETLLAQKTLSVPGKPGTDISGAQIPVPEAVDKVFVSGPGTCFSEDQLKIFADADGQPHLDAKGTVSVFSELSIDGDVDYNTGNIHFEGNIIVRGNIKEGFKVKGATLTVEQIEGAEIDLTGDLNVASGIIDARLIKVQGTVQAKYVNNSVIKAFGDLIVQKEIIDSEILLSGACINETGVIIASDIKAKLGIQAGHIGTEISLPSTLKVGTDDHNQDQISAIDEQLKNHHDAVELLKETVEGLESEDQALNAEIAKYAHVQDRSQLEIRDIEKLMPALKESGNLISLKKMSNTVSDLRKRVTKAEQDINRAFARQDAIEKEIKEKKDQIKAIEEINKHLVIEKRGLIEFSSKHAAQPIVKATKKIMPGTVIEGPHSKLKVKDELSRCKIQEISRGEEGSGNFYYEMEIMNL